MISKWYGIYSQRTMITFILQINLYIGANPPFEMQAPPPHIFWAMTHSHKARFFFIDIKR